MSITPCKGCEDRKLYCHSSCERYAKFKDEHEVVRKNMKLEAEARQINTLQRARHGKKIGLV